MLTGNWTANANGISPVRCLACLAFPIMLASRGLHHRTLTASGAIAVLQIGFIMTLANISFLMVFACYLVLAEFKPYSRRLPRTYLNVMCESGLAFHIAFFYLVEIGCVDFPLDFRRYYLSTWLGVSIIGSFAVSLGRSVQSSVYQSIIRGGLVGLSYWFGLFLSSNSSLSLRLLTQVSSITIGMIGGFSGACLSTFINRIGFGQESSPQYHDMNYGLKVIMNVLTGLLLPRIALELNSWDVNLWKI
eukprot:TCALIF_06089-PA protein Name:"Similar to TMEM19 Transmembrane protein 19 (Homo sapiens)" AED:0.08 eAED:0.08 QI:0/-1/0/1/-1/1/1/0/246